MTPKTRFPCQDTPAHDPGQESPARGPASPGPGRSGVDLGVNPQAHVRGLVPERLGSTLPTRSVRRTWGSNSAPPYRRRTPRPSALAAGVRRRVPGGGVQVGRQHLRGATLRPEQPRDHAPEIPPRQLTPHRLISGKALRPLQARQREEPASPLLPEDLAPRLFPGLALLSRLRAAPGRFALEVQQVGI